MIVRPPSSSAAAIPVIVVEDVARPKSDGKALHRLAKRAVDILLAGIGLIAFSPVLIISVLAIMVTSAGSPFFTQSRVGYRGRRFTMFKLRTMVKGAHLQHQPLLQKMKADARVFPVGRLLRRTSIDELPNLLNVLKGDMSIVGPRPMLENEIRYCAERHGDQAVAERLTVKPGITGLWQISGRANLHFDERVELDIAYARDWTLSEDLKIIAKTIPALLLSRGAF